MAQPPGSPVGFNMFYPIANAINNSQEVTDSHVTKGHSKKHLQEGLRITENCSTQSEGS